MTIVWRPAMSVRNEWSDDDHRRLIDRVNAVDTAVQAADEGHSLSGTSLALTRYRQVHVECGGRPAEAALCSGCAAP